MRLPLTASICLLASVCAAQQATYTYVDQRPPYQPDPSWLTALNLPRIGVTLQIQVPSSVYTCCPFEKTYYLATGVANPDLHTPWLGGYLYTTADVSVVGSQHGTGFTTIVIPIPNASSLLGAHFHQQVLVWARNSFWSTLELSRGGHGVIGL